MIRRVAAEPALIAGAGRALLLQLAHPKVAQGVADHSDFENDPLPRLTGTLDFLTFVVWGTPEEVYQRLVEYRERTDCGALIGIFSYGGMPHDLARANITLFAEKVLPRLQLLDAGCDIGGVRPAA